MTSQIRTHSKFSLTATTRLPPVSEEHARVDEKVTKKSLKLLIPEDHPAIHGSSVSQVSAFMSLTRDALFEPMLLPVMGRSPLMPESLDPHRLKSLALSDPIKLVIHNPGCKEAVIAACSVDGLAIRFADPKLKQDLDVAMVAVIQNPLAFDDLLPPAKENPQIAQEACSRDGFCLAFMSSAQKKDPSLVEAACMQNGLALQFADHSLRSDKKIVQSACTQNGYSLRFASDELRDDEALVTLAVHHAGIPALRILSLEEPKETIGHSLLDIEDMFCPYTVAKRSAIAFFKSLSCTPLEYASKRLKQNEALKALSVSIERHFYEDSDEELVFSFEEKPSVPKSSPPPPVSGKLQRLLTLGAESPIEELPPFFVPPRLEGAKAPQLAAKVTLLQRARLMSVAHAAGGAGYDLNPAVPYKGFLKAKDE